MQAAGRSRFEETKGSVCCCGRERAKDREGGRPLRNQLAASSLRMGRLFFEPLKKQSAHTGEQRLGAMPCEQPARTTKQSFLLSLARCQQRSARRHRVRVSLALRLANQLPPAGQPEDKLGRGVGADLRRAPAAARMQQAGRPAGGGAASHAIDKLAATYLHRRLKRTW